MVVLLVEEEGMYALVISLSFGFNIKMYDRPAKTKNISEARFQGMMSKRHLSVFAFLAELQIEQSDTTTMLGHLDLGLRKKPTLSSKRKEASRYDEFKRMKIF